MPIGKINNPTASQTGVGTASRTADPSPKSPSEGAFQGQSRVTGVKPLDASQPTIDPVVKNHIESAEQFHEDIRDFDELMQAGASHPDRLRDASDRVVVQPSPYETPVTTKHPAEYEKPVTAYEVPSSSKARVDHDYEDIDALRPGEVFDHLAPKLPQPNAKAQPSAYETPVTAQRPADYEKPVTAYETPVTPYETPASAHRPAEYEAPVQQKAAEPIYAEIGPGKSEVIYDRLEPARPGNQPTPNPIKVGGIIQGKETSV